MVGIHNFCMGAENQVCVTQVAIPSSVGFENQLVTYVAVPNSVAFENQLETLVTIPNFLALRTS